MFPGHKTSGLNLSRAGQEASETPVLVIVSGYFSPLHCGHLDYLEAAAEFGDRLVVIVNNNQQQVLKKGKIILDEQDRLRIVQALSVVDEAMISIDDDQSVKESITHIAKMNMEHTLVFGNGGDRNHENDIPEREVCKAYGIRMVFDFGGTEKSDSSTRINRELGLEEGN